MAPLLLLALLPGGKHRAPPVLGQEDGAAVAGLEIARPDLPPVEEREGQPVGEDRAQLLHQVERQARTAGTAAESGRAARRERGSEAMLNPVIHGSIKKKN